MEFTETRRLYQQLAAELKQRIESGRYPVGDKLPAERYIAEEMNVSRTVVREAIIMLEVEGYVDVRKGSGIHVVSNQQKHLVVPGDSIEFATAGPFELLQARQLIESNIAEFAATQVTKQDIVQLMEIQEHARKEDRFRDSQWDLKFHVQVALATQNTAMATIVEKCGCSGSTTLTGKTARAYRRTFDRQLVRRSRSNPQGADAQRSLRRQTGDVAAPGKHQADAV